MSSTFEKPTYELPLSEIIPSSLDLYLNRPLDFVLPFLVAAVISAIPSFFTSRLEELFLHLGTAMPPSALMAEVVSTSIIAGILSLIAQVIANGIAIKYAYEILEGRTLTLSDALSFVLHKAVSLVIAGIVTGFLIVLGFLLLIVPGIILATMFYLFDIAIVIEQMGALDGIQRSGALVEGRWLKTFGLMITLVALSLIVEFPAMVLASSVPIQGPLGAMLSSLPINIFPALMGPVGAISKAYLYYSMKVKGTKRTMPLPPPPPPI